RLLLLTPHLAHPPFFFFTPPPPTEIYTLSLHDALPISRRSRAGSAWSSPNSRTRSTRTTSPRRSPIWSRTGGSPGSPTYATRPRSEEHTSELQSPCNLVCRLLLDKKKKKKIKANINHVK